MKNLIILLTLVLTPFLSKADAWDNLTLEEANKVVAYLEENPFIYDYCDCCGTDESSSATLLQVKSTEIVTCSWDENFYSVKVEVKPIVNVFGNGENLHLDNLSAYTVPKDGGAEDPYVDGYTIYMNYTWAFNKDLKKVTPILSFVEYNYYGETPSDKGTCKAFTEFPDPIKHNKAFKNRKYKKWYKKMMIG